jgi:hypothetical protein
MGRIDSALVSDLKRLVQFAALLLLTDLATNKAARASRPTAAPRATPPESFGSIPTPTENSPFGGVKNRALLSQLALLSTG